jgi:DNA-binding transcriptional regulator YbjK
MEPDRKILIADAAIALLGNAGSKGLTHRGVDAEAGLPQGSTSFYCRTRQELLSLALTRHAALDMDDIVADAQKMARSKLSRETFIELLVERVEDWLSAPKRARLIARFELFMMASREPDLAGVVTQQRAHFLQAIETALVQIGVAEPARVAPTLLVVVDAMLLDQIGASAPLLSLDQTKAMLRAVLKSPG